MGSFALNFVQSEEAKSHLQSFFMSMRTIANCVRCNCYIYIYMYICNTYITYIHKHVLHFSTLSRNMKHVVNLCLLSINVKKGNLYLFYEATLKHQGAIYISALLLVTRWQTCLVKWEKLRSLGSRLLASVKTMRYLPPEGGKMIAFSLCRGWSTHWHSLRNTTHARYSVCAHTAPRYTALPR